MRIKTVYVMNMNIGRQGSVPIVALFHVFVPRMMRVQTLKMIAILSLLFCLFLSRFLHLFNEDDESSGRKLEPKIDKVQFYSVNLFYRYCIGLDIFYFPN